jgi:hypothetical protein
MFLHMRVVPCLIDNRHCAVQAPEFAGQYTAWKMNVQHKCSFVNPSHGPVS